MRLLSIGDCVKPGSYRLHSCFKRAVNYVHRGRLVSVVDESIGPGPLNIVLRPWAVAAGILPAVEGGILPPGVGIEPFRASARRQPVPPGRMPGSTAGKMPAATPRATAGILRVGPGTILFAGRRYHFTSRQRYYSALELPAVAQSRLRRNLATFGEFLRKTAPPHSLAFLLDEGWLKCFRTGFARALAAQIQQGAQQAFHGDLLKGVAELKGCGVGLTPSGDDFIAGLLIGLNFLQKLHGSELQRLADAVCRAARGSSLFSNTAMELARQGLLFGRVKEVLLALVSGNGPSLRRAVQKLLAVGASSGADLATGLFLTLNQPDKTLERWTTQTAAPKRAARSGSAKIANS